MVISKLKTEGRPTRQRASVQAAAEGVSVSAEWHMFRLMINDEWTQEQLDYGSKLIERSNAEWHRNSTL